MSGFVLRASTAADVPAIASIYAHHVRSGLGSFEETPPTAEDVARRRDAVLALGLPFTVAEGGGRVLGYAYAQPYRPRSAYRFSLEDSIYVAADSTRRGIGHALLADLVGISARLGYRQMVAVIGDSANLASIRLHEKLGFARIGVLPAVGFKLGRWVDSVLMQRALGEGAQNLPAEKPPQAATG
jgi:L-amino acid N-acyltransferase YncA